MMSAKLKPAASKHKTRGTPRPDAGQWVEEHWQQIAEGAYYRAEKRGFAPGGEEEDWFRAEEEIRARERGQSR
jgi:hypothetical protein